MILPIALIVLAVLIIIIGIIAIKQNKKEVEIFKKSGVDFKSKINGGKFIGGHPEINQPFEFCKLFLKGENILITTNKSVQYEEKGIIPCNKISEVNVLDSSTVEKKVTLGRVLLVGIFALAWKKNKKNEMHFLEINWNDGKFEHSTLFCYEGSMSQTLANTARNSLIKILKSK